MMGASSAFTDPAGFQTNLIIQGSDGYSFADFAKAVVVLLVTPIVYGF